MWNNLLLPKTLFGCIGFVFWCSDSKTCLDSTEPCITSSHFSLQNMDVESSPLNLLVVGSGITTLILASALAYVLLNKNQSKDKVTDATLSATSSVSSNEQALDKSLYPAGNLYLYYATQTGTAESFCKQIEREAPRHGFYAHVVDVEDVEDASQLQSPCVLLSATYGEGEPTDNSAVLAQQLQAALGKTILGQPMEEKSEEPLSLAHVDFAVFGLGKRRHDLLNCRQDSGESISMLTSPFPPLF